MPSIPEFAEAVTQFQAFLRSEGVPTRIVWAFRDDVWQRGLERVLVRSPVSHENHELVEKVFRRRKGQGTGGNRCGRAGC